MVRHAAGTNAAANIKKKRWLISLLNERIGDKPISKLTPGDILGATRPVEAVGHTVTAHKLVGTAGQICRFARACGYIVFNPAADRKEVLKPIKSQHYAAITDPTAVGHLPRGIDEYQGGAVVGYALKILPYLALRSAELRGGRWSEIDLDKALWTIPASRQKNPKDGGGMKMRIAHTVPLPTEAVRLFRELHLLTGCGELCFPGRHQPLHFGHGAFERRPAYGLRAKRSRLLGLLHRDNCPTACVRRIRRIY
ncbi:hypothetical protein [Desulfovibrio sp.]|uniref:tyrosine-type recombinase/integrase n=1 Tax=Desulfovibrio sp. TaxID=885 RepID=UPI00260FB9EE|nr:hypothetical protein [Desulfovibrio sp.]